MEIIIFIIKNMSKGCFNIGGTYVKAAFKGIIPEEEINITYLMSHLISKV